MLRTASSSSTSFVHQQHLFDRACHLVIVLLALGGAFLMRFDFSLPAEALRMLKGSLLIAGGVKIAMFHIAGMHRMWRRTADTADLLRLLLYNVCASVVFGFAAFWRFGSAFPRSIYVIDLMLCFLLTALACFYQQLVNEFLTTAWPGPGRKRILIYGAGVAGSTLLREIRSNRSLGYEVLGFLDDDPAKRKARITGVRVLGSGREAASIVDHLRRRHTHVDEIVIAMPSAPGRAMREALANCRAAGVECKTIPGVGELLSGKFLAAQLRNVSVADLLGREPIHLDEGPIHSSIAGRSVLITGAAGSIGSELCRQVARFSPARIVAFDQAESELFRLDGEMRSKFPDVTVIPRLGDIRDPHEAADVIERYSVDAIFHAAAYKHVPLLEGHVLEAVRNNILGTWNLLVAARQQRGLNFVMISSDKAVNPTSFMGATKRVCERMVSAAATGRSGRATRFISVRFGNVLASNGSVVPIFQAQIAKGGPVTVTHPDIRRYFMTIPEAVSLVLQASTMGKDSEIFVLDMGQPIRILDLAVNMIRLAGLEPHDIDIRFTGLRPGEKLFEELNTDGENILPTYHNKIKIFQDEAITWNTLVEWVGALKAGVAARDELAVVEQIRGLVPEYRAKDKSITKCPALVKAASPSQRA